MVCTHDIKDDFMNKDINMYEWVINILHVSSTMLWLFSVTEVTQNNTGMHTILPIDNVSLMPWPAVFVWCDPTFGEPLWEWVSYYSGNKFLLDHEGIFLLIFQSCTCKGSTICIFRDSNCFISFYPIRYINSKIPLWWHLSKRGHPSINDAFFMIS